MIAKVKRKLFREKKSVREILRRTNVSRHTVRKWLKTSVLGPPTYQLSEMSANLMPSQETVKQALKVDIHREETQAAYGVSSAPADQAARLQR